MNRLGRETSPYLLQHADNPVDWYPWGDEAFARARAEQKPILLSVGYSACHWCHVMAHESFEDEAIAARMNHLFVNIKVDREERPDVDSVYMTFTQALTGQGGWPMTVFLTPDLQPIYAGTYFPPEDRFGRPGFRRLMDSVAAAWDENREGVLASADRITAQVREATERAPSAEGAVTAETTAAVVQTLRSLYDAQWGGFGRAPKFPSPSNLEFLLMHHARTGGAGESPSAVEMVLHTCRQMWAGGMYDHLGGGFARYSVDGQWLVPHFEKMLYDNASLARLYLHAYQVSGDEAFATVARETLDYLQREMRDPDGGFHAAQDADSEGIEGKFFVWTPEEVDAALGAEDGALARAVYGVTPAGNFQDPHHPEFGRRTVLSRPQPLEAVAVSLGVTVADVDARLPAIRARLLEARSRRTWPGLDDKVLTSWNGLALAAFAEAARILDDPVRLTVALEVAAFLRNAMWRNGRFLHTYKAGVARVDGMLEDYAYVGLGLVDLYRATGDRAHLDWAAELFEAARTRFHDDEGGGFFEAPLDGEALLLRQKPYFDSPTPSGNGAMALLGFWLGRYFARDDWEAVTREVTSAVAEQLERAATGFGSVLQAAELLLAERREVAITGTPEQRAPFEREVAARYLPSMLIAPGEAGTLPILEGRDLPAAYVCRDFVCDLPALDREALREQLDR
ncbi:MAG: thioredoxin domain-containing protein [Chloroflexi bacterium]|nr:thioredoxin domain-containing protein [Chloroflexota bacterium]MDA1240919.1 thioredoxin domain-containing protein [Chloroflexota bacterium]